MTGSDRPVGTSGRPPGTTPPEARDRRSSLSEEPDFAGEHAGTTLAGEVPDGPEHARDDDEPHGLAGQDPTTAG